MTRTQMTALGFEETGKRLKDLLAGVRVELHEKAVKSFAEEVRLRLRRMILVDGFRSPPLTARYVAWKAAQGFASTPLIRTGDYLRSIKVGRQQKGWAVFVDATQRSREGVPMEKLAVWLEYGTRRMPARPHWRPTTEWASKRWADYVKAKVRARVHRS